MEKFIIKYPREWDAGFIDEMLEYSFNNPEAGIGYPRYDKLKDFKAEIEDYDSTLEDSRLFIKGTNLLESVDFYMRKVHPQVIYLDLL